MTVTFRAHFDGKVLVPDEPIDLPVDQPLEVQWAPLVEKEERPFAELTIEERLARIRKAAGCISGPTIPEEALRRENLYEERV